MSKQIAIQGFEGSFHHIAAHELLGKNVQILPCKTFREVISLAEDNTKTLGGLMAIENSIAGSILPNYSLLMKSNLQITGEIYLQIQQNLLGLPGVAVKEITEVHSHPMALLQCADYLEKHHWALVETEDTALSAKQLREKNDMHVGVIASRLAAEIYDLDVLKLGIQSQKNNYTRFLLVQKPDNAIKVDNADKASINFRVDHSRGSLAKVLTKIAELEVNLSKLQSMPIPEKEWQYSFHADLEFENDQVFEKVIKALRAVTEKLLVLGVYSKGKTISE